MPVVAQRIWYACCLEGGRVCDTKQVKFDAWRRWSFLVGSLQVYSLVSRSQRKAPCSLQCPASLNKITRDIKRLCCLNGFLFSHYTRFQFDMSRHARFDQRTDFDQRRDPPHLSWTWEFEFWLSLKGRHYKCITNAFHGMTCSSKIRDFFFHSGMPESSAKILPISQYAWELMNMLEDTRPQSQVWSERPIAAADSLFWIFWWQGFCKEASLMKGKYEHIILHTCACCCTKNMICLLFGRGASVWYKAGQIWRLTKMILLGWKLTGLQFGK